MWTSLHLIFNNVKLINYQIKQYKFAPTLVHVHTYHTQDIHTRTCSVCAVSINMRLLLLLQKGNHHIWQDAINYQKQTT